MLDTKQYFNDLYPIIAKRFELEVDEGNKLINTLIDVVDNEKIDYRLDSMGGYGEIPKYNGTTLTNLDQKRGFTTIITPEERAAVSSVTFKYAKVDQSGEAKKVGQKLGMSMRATIYNDFLRLFQRAYDSNYLLADGDPWASTTHLVTSDPTVTDTYSNLITNVLGTAGLDAALKLGSRYVTADGLPTGMNYNIVLVSPELEQKAAELFGRNRKLTPDKLPESAENSANPYYDMMWYVVGAGPLGLTAKQWAIADAKWLKMTASLVYITRPMVKQMQNTPWTTQFYPYSDYNYGVSEARSIIFSNPA